ncbi:MAG: tetratricopeptide repeat protein [Anaerolineales bacterium]|jgi:tetratricopeptide (TPR) repeat protein
MRGTKIRMLRRLIKRAYAGFVVLTMLLAALVGCATDGKNQALVADETQVGEERSMEPTVVRLEDGRKGFVITEVSGLDEASRGDFDRAVAMLKGEDYDEAIVLLEKVIDQSPGVTAPYIDIAIAYRHIGKPEQAEENLKTALELFPEHPVACNEYGLLYRKTGRFTEARAMYEKAIARFPDYYPAHKNLGILCDLYLDDSTCALEHYEIYSKAKPEDEKVKMWIADLRARLGRN